MMRRMTPQTMGDQLRSARKAKGLALDDVAYELRRRAGIKTTVATLSRMETSYIAEDASKTTLVVALAKLLDLDLEELSPFHAAERDRMINVLDPARNLVIPARTPLAA